MSSWNGENDLKRESWRLQEGKGRVLTSGRLVTHYLIFQYHGCLYQENEAENKNKKTEEGLFFLYITNFNHKNDLSHLILFYPIVKCPKWSSFFVWWLPLLISTKSRNLCISGSNRSSLLYTDKQTRVGVYLDPKRSSTTSKSAEVLHTVGIRKPLLWSAVTSKWNLVLNWQNGTCVHFTWVINK